MTVPDAATDDLLTLDWNKYNDYMLATGGADGLLRVWVRPVFALNPCEVSPRRPTHSCRCPLPPRTFGSSARQWPKCQATHEASFASRHPLSPPTCLLLLHSECAPRGCHGHMCLYTGSPGWARVREPSDTSVKLWDWTQQRAIMDCRHHTEFALGLDFSLFHADLLATCAWDRSGVYAKHPTVHRHHCG